MEQKIIIVLFIGIIFLLLWGVKLIKKDALKWEKENFALWKENIDLKKSNKELLEANYNLTKKNGK